MRKENEALKHQNTELAQAQKEAEEARLATAQQLEEQKKKNEELEQNALAPQPSEPAAAPEEAPADATREVVAAEEQPAEVKEQPKEEVTKEVEGAKGNPAKEETPKAEKEETPKAEKKGSKEKANQADDKASKSSQGSKKEKAKSGCC
ncbi:hypothetical protein AGDE_14100 [Angomonas deanei]|nr:hypothetical protein AGDE_14100 [Angomonas deanei]|eukprot:EPY21420.1 hypothetical protein AGDE_14100 [Angomonas deanei]